MRSATSVLLLLVASCGNYSNEDVLFAEAVPQSESLKLALPQNAPAPASCPYPSYLWVYALTTGAALNTSVADFLIDIDLARASSPSVRLPGERVWGPWNDRNHPGFQGELLMTLQADAGTTFNFVIEERRDGDSSWTDLVDGHFIGSEASHGAGDFAIHFGAARKLGINNPTDPKADLAVSYDLGAVPLVIRLDLAGAALTDPLPPFLYEYQGGPDGGGSFAFAWFDADAGAEVHATAAFQADGSGGGSYSVGNAGIDECWDAKACTNYLTVPGVFRSCGIHLTACQGMPKPANCPPAIP
jgi:hypothetical protein